MPQPLPRQNKPSSATQPLSEVTLANPPESTLRLVPLADFNPPVKPGKTIAARTLGLSQAVVLPNFLNLKTTLAKDDPATPGQHEGLQEVADVLAKQYFPKHQALLRKLGISDVRALTPRQGLQLASAITIERLTYSDKQISPQGNASERIVNDEAAVDRLLVWENDPDGNGVCRNYSAVMCAVFEAIKLLQTPETDRLGSSYMVALGFNDNQGPGAVRDHAWNGFFTCTNDSVYATVVDATWADSETKGKDPATAGLPVTQLDYTRQRGLTLVNHFEQAKLLLPATLVKQLLQQVGEARPITVPKVTKANINERIREVPHSILLAERAATLLDEHPRVVAQLRPKLSAFLLRYAEDLEKYCSSLEDAPFLARKPALESLAVYPLTERLQQAATLIEEVPESQREAVRKRFVNLLSHVADRFGAPRYRAHFIDVDERLLQTAELLGAHTFADRYVQIAFQPRLAAKGGAQQVATKALQKIFDDLSQERQQRYRVLLKGTVILKQPEPQSEWNKLTQQWREKWGGRVLVSFSVDDEKQRITFLRRMDALFSKNNLDPGSLDLDISTDKEHREGYSEGRLVLHPEMSDQEIIEKFQNTALLHKRLSEIRSRCPAKLQISPIGTTVIPAETLKPFLDAVEKYMTAATRKNLLAHRVITLSSYENTDDYLNTTIKADHFFSPVDTAEIDRLLSQSNRQAIVEQEQRVDLQRNYQKLEGEAIVKAIVIKDVAAAADLLKPLSAYVDGDRGVLRFLNLSRDPLTLELTSYSKNIFGKEDDILLEKNLPYYLVRSLSFQGQRTLVAEGGISAQGVVTADALPASIFEYGASGYGVEVVRGEKRFRPVNRDGKMLLQAADGTTVSELLKGDLIKVPENPTAYLDWSGEKIVVFPGASQENLGKRLDELADQYAALRSNLARTKQGLRVIPWSSGREFLGAEELKRIKDTVDEFNRSSISLFAFDKAALRVAERTFALEMESNDGTFRYLVSGLLSIKEVETYATAAGKVETQAAAIAKQGVRIEQRTLISSNLLQGNRAAVLKLTNMQKKLSQLQAAAETGNYRGYTAEVRSTKPDRLPEGAKVLPGKDIAIIAAQKRILVW